jgi:hypothetical protein
MHVSERQTMQASLHSKQNPTILIASMVIKALSLMSH